MTNRVDKKIGNDLPDWLQSVLRGHEQADQARKKWEGDSKLPSFAELAERTGSAKSASFALHAYEKGRTRQKSNRGIIPLDTRTKATGHHLPTHRGGPARSKAQTHAPATVVRHGSKKAEQPLKKLRSQPPSPSFHGAATINKPNRPQWDGLYSFAKGLEYFTRPGPFDQYNDWFTDLGNLQVPQKKSLPSA